MKRLITMVGTSIFENYLKEHNDTNFKNAYNFFKVNRIKAEELEKERSRKNKIIESILREDYFRNNIGVSAEIKSLVKLKEELKEDFEIHLLYSDTALSCLAAEILQSAIEYYDKFQEDFGRVQIKKIEGLQIWSREEFSKGMVNLINTIYNIAQEYWDNIIINITGGYKATIPYLAILAQVNRCPIYYIFEDTDALIKIPYIPININWELFEKYWQYFDKMAHPNFLSKTELPHNVLNECYDLLEETKLNNITYVSLNPIGQILWKKYKSKFFIFYAPEEVYNEIQQQNNIKRILTEKFWKKDVRQSKTENKNGHYVYDDGNNPYRIFYFEESEKIFIYKTFESHEKYQKYLENIKINKKFKEEIIKNSKIYKEEV